MNPKDGHAILHHVAKAVHAYKEKYNPSSFTFTANHEKKASVYKQFAKHLAKHYGGTYKPSPYSNNIHAVVFNDK